VHIDIAYQQRNHHSDIHGRLPVMYRKTDQPPGGVKTGHVYSETAELDFRATANPSRILIITPPCSGLNHRKLRFERSIRLERLTDGQSAKIVNRILKTLIT
jgi:hypothetical protein